MSEIVKIDKGFRVTCDYDPTDGVDVFVGSTGTLVLTANVNDTSCTVLIGTNEVQQFINALSELKI
jgi:hypothetical protein